MKNTTKVLAPGIMAVLMAFTPTKTKLTVSSSAFTENGMIPSKYTCEGPGISPPLGVSNIPAAAKSLAIIVHDPDAAKPGGVTHWVAWDLPLDGQIPEDFKGGHQGQNTSNKTGYMGMCPPDGTHHYHFKVFALNCMLQLGASTDEAALKKAMQGHILAEGDLTGLYKKSK